MEEATEILFEASDDGADIAAAPLPEEQVAPWLSAETRGIANANFRLHNEIIDFYNYIRPSEATNKARYACFATIKEILERAVAESFVGTFGSFATQLYLPNSDVDLVIISERHSIAELMRLTARALRAREDLFSSIEVIKARVPLVKFRMPAAQFEFDITFNESGGITNAREVIAAQKLHPEVPYLLFVMKLALRQRHMNNTFQGGIGSYLLFLMVLAFVRDFKADLRRRRAVAHLQATLAEYLVGFLNFWGKFQYRTHEVIVAHGGRVREKRRPSDALTVYSPINDEDVGGSAFRFRSALGMFKNRANFLCNYPYAEGESVLKYFLNPSRRDFRIYLA